MECIDGKHNRYLHNDIEYGAGNLSMFADKAEFELNVKYRNNLN